MSLRALCVRSGQTQATPHVWSMPSLTAIMRYANEFMHALRLSLQSKSASGTATSSDEGGR